MMIAVFKIFCACVIASTTATVSDFLPPTGLPDPYSLICPGGSNCAPIPSNFNFFNPPTYCYNGFCSYVQYTNRPWAAGSELVIQPMCEIPLGAKNIPAGKLRIELKFFSNSVTGIQQWSFTQLSTFVFTNTADILETGTIEFHFLMRYTGTISYWPDDYYTPAPQGVCLFSVVA